MATEPWAIGLVLSAAIVGSLAPILIKKASADVHFTLRSLKNKKLLGGISLYAIGTMLFIPSLKGGELSVLYPIVSVTYVFVALLSVKLLDEKMTALKWIGISFIIAGVTFIGLGS